MITVVGGVNIDIGGVPDAPLVLGDSNPGAVGIYLGGVGRNIAHNLALMGCEVGMITAIGDDYNAGLIRESCREHGIDLSHSVTLPGERTSIYLYINERGGDMHVAVNDMSIYKNLTPAVMESRLDVLNGSDMVILDANLPEETIAWIASKCTAPLAANTVSFAKAPRLIPALGALQMIAANRMEAEAMSGVRIRTETDMWRAADVMLGTGLRRVFITLGEEGVFTCDKIEMRRFKSKDCKLVNTNGASDAFTAGLAAAFTAGGSWEQCALCGLAAAAFAVESQTAVNEEITREKLFARAGVSL